MTALQRMATIKGMKKSKLFAWSLLAFSIAAIVGLACWNYYQTRRFIFDRHSTWVHRLTDQMDTVRQYHLNQVANWTLSEKPDLKALASQDSGSLVALFFNDTEYHKGQDWKHPTLPSTMATLDPRLVALELDVLNTHKTTLGPLLLVKNTFYTTVVRPIDDFRVLVAIYRDPTLFQLLDEQAKFWHLEVYVFDRSGKPIYSKGDLSDIQPFLTRLLAEAANGNIDGWVPMEGQERWKKAATYHDNHTTDWLFVLSEPAFWLYTPLFFFLISLLVLGGMASLPWRAATTLQNLSWKQDLDDFSQSADRFIRGKDGALSDPKEKLASLSPVVHTLRWLMPQWKKAESFPRELALERKLVSLLIESLPEGILFFNSQGALQLGNELGKVFLTLQQEAGKETRNLGAMQLPRGFLEPYLEPVFASHQRTLGKEVEVSWADGKHLYRVWVEAVQTQDDRVDGFIVVIRDITFRKQWEYVQEQVLSGITHDLRGPLSAVMGYLDLMKRQVKDDASPKLVEYIRLAREGGQRLSQMVSDILDVVRFEQGKIDLETQAVPVSDLFKRLQATFGVNATQKNVQLVFEGADELGLTVSADPKLLERVFDNLVGNAIKFTPGGGTITVSAQRLSGRIQFLVKDTGRGIPKEAQSRIFDKFQQVRPGDRAAGYGLGLAVAKFIIDAHKGEIHVDSEVGKGSMFTITIPDVEPSLKALQDLPPPLSA